MNVPSEVSPEVILPLLGKSFLSLNTIPHQGIFHCREPLTKLGGFDPDHPGCGDSAFPPQLNVRGVEFRLLPKQVPAWII